MQVSRWVVLVTIGLACGCSGAKKPFDPSLAGHEFFLCCNMHFSPDLRATDANYEHYGTSEETHNAASPMVAAGSRVRVVEVESFGIQFQTDDRRMYTLEFNDGRKAQTPAQYFHNILRDTNPLAALTKAPPALTIPILDGRLVNGMTKEQAIIARGYPPADRTPSIESNEWLYYESPESVDHVVFANGRIASVTREPAPQ